MELPRERDRHRPASGTLIERAILLELVVELQALAETNGLRVAKTILNRMTKTLKG